jgi:hypothetical protein
MSVSVTIPSGFPWESTTIRLPIFSSFISPAALWIAVEAPTVTTGLDITFLTKTIFTLHKFDFKGYNIIGY